ncbi:MAG: DinB family protein [Bacteroidetes bacterium]|nr:DinB family protein [Bacteroidota bacterium]MCW5895952.1 DinB family protein [Bacteroidota bacterium]
MKTPSAEIRLLLQLIDEAYERKTWHGPNLKGSLRGVSAEEAAWRPNAHRHSIWEIAVHAAYWKYTVRRRLLDEKRGSFPLKGSNWFTLPADQSDALWKQHLHVLEQTHRSMREAIGQFPASKLYATTSQSKVTNIAVIYGIANHDIYHAGQIQLLKRLHERK